MLEPQPTRRILAWREPVDMRKSFDGLVGLVRDAKRLDRGRFAFPGQDQTQSLSTEQFRLILDGIVLGGRSCK